MVYVPHGPFCGGCFGQWFKSRKGVLQYEESSPLRGREGHDKRLRSMAVFINTLLEQVNNNSLYEEEGVKRVLEEMQLNIANKGLVYKLDLSDTAFIEKILKTYWCGSCGKVRFKEEIECCRCSYIVFHWVTLNLRERKV